MTGATTIVTLSADFPYEDVMRVADRLGNAGICVASFVPALRSLYHPHEYLFANAEGIETVLLPDRNVTSRFAQLARGYSTAGDDQLQTAATLLAFCQSLEILIEPSIAFHELAHKSGNDDALAELAFFRMADNANVWAVLNIALERFHRLPEAARGAQPEIPAANLARPLHRWRRNYLIALKIVELRYARLTPMERMTHLMDWMMSDLFFAGPAVLFAAVYFAPNSPPIGGVFKQINSADREAAIRGIKNAAWDITQLSDLVNKVNASADAGNRRYIFASFDVYLRLVATLLFEAGTAASPPEALPTALERWWPPRDAVHLAGAIRGHAQVAASGGREVNMAKVMDNTYLDALVERGEMVVRAGLIR